MKRLQNTFIILVVVLSLGLLMSAPATAASKQTMKAGVSVVEHISFTIDDNLPLGLSFGSILPGTIRQAEETQNADMGAIAVTLEVESNSNCKIDTKADDFISETDIMAIDNIEWNTEDDDSTATAMAKQYAEVAVISANETQGIWYWISIPEGQNPGDYTSSFWIQTQGVNKV